MPVREIVARLRAEGARDYSRDVGEAAEETERFGETAQGSAERSSQAWRGMADETRSATDKYASQLGVAQQETAGFSGAVDEYTAEANTAWHGAATATGSAVGDYSAHVGSAVEDTQTFAGETEETADTVETSWGNISTAVSGGLAAVGGGLEALNRSQQDTRDVAARVAGSIDTVTDEVMGAAAEMNNATRDIDELVAMMEIGAQRGVRSREDLQEYAAIWDTIGDATGENAVALAHASTALEAVGISARQPQEAMDAFGFVTRHTTADVGGFLDMTEQVGRELGEQAPHVNEMAALLKAMEDRGMGARRAQREVRQALREADGEMQSALDTLGVSNSAMNEYTAMVEGSSKAIEHNADAHAENRTTLQEWSSEAESAMARYSGLTQTVELAGPALMGAAGAMYVATSASRGLSAALQFARNSTVAQRTAMVALHTVYYTKAAAAGVATAATSAYTAASGAATAASYALGAAFRFMLGPIGLAITAIGAAVAAGTYLYQNWDEVTTWVKDAWQSVGDFLSNLWDGIVSTFKRGANAAIEPINSLIDAFNAVAITLPTIPDWVPVVGGKGGQTIGFDIPNVPTFSMSSSSATGGHPTSSTAGGRTGHPGGFNTGGPVPGGGPDRDSVPAMLTPGEWVLSRSAVEGLGAETLATIEQAGRRRRGGGDGLSAGEMMFGGDAAGPGVLQRNLGGDAAGPGVLQRNLGGLVEFGSGLEGTPYVWGGVNPSGVDCSGYTSALAAKALGQHPWQRRHTTSTIDSDPAFARGLQSGFEVGVSTAGQLGGIGHMGATVGGVGMEATPPEVRVGPEARGATHSLFRQRYGFRGLAGEQGALSDPKGDASNIPFWARPVLDAIADALSGAFGLPEEGWADGAVHDRPWRGIANVGERETELTTPVSLLDDRIDAGLARHDGAGRQPVVIQEGAIQVRDSGSPRDTADAVLAELEDRLAW